ncbi:MAG: ADP-ribosylglycohydrolase family protein [Muribaculaceae bacterium]|nr:ADP-ribosylglycohydrolase family protein [Muribaculaceae bacterium]
MNESIDLFLQNMGAEQLRNRCRGSLVGGAVGDALGYEVEFMRLSEIRKRFGEGGISDYVLHGGRALFSDDTQMSLFTAEGLLAAVVDGKIFEKEILPYITTAYQHWYYTQSCPPMKKSGSWLTHIGPLWARRAPGMTCMSALHDISMANRAPVVNNSKGCGGVMRVAPIGIFAAAHRGVLDLEHAAYLAGYAADITHKHPLSTYSSMALAMIVADCIAYGPVDRSKFRFIVMERTFNLLGLYFEGDEHLAGLRALTARALDLAESDKSDADAIGELGEGWVAEETLAIAVYSVMRYIDNFEKCVVCAVNHDGDSDSTGAVAGNIIGALLGYRAIPEKYLRNLELHDLLVSVADDLGGMSDEKQMKERYVDHKPYNVNHLYLV